MEKETRNFFLSNQGVCLKHNLLLFDSVHRYPVAICKQYKRAIIDYYIARYTRTGKYKILGEDQICLVVNHPWFNYYHWMAEAIPRIVRYNKELCDLTLIMPQSIYNLPFVKESLLPFKFKEVIINEGWHYYIKRGIISPIQPYCYHYEASLIQETRNIYLNYFLKKKTFEPYRKIYVSRKNALRRKFVNEEHVIELMKKYDFEIIELENATLKEQVTLFSETKCLVSMHGAALTNMLFMSNNTKVIELYRKKTNIFSLKSKVYSNLAPILALNHAEIACKPLNKKDDFFSGDLIVDITEIENKIKNE